MVWSEGFRSLMCVGNTFPTPGWHLIYPGRVSSSSLTILLPVKFEIPQEIWKGGRMKCYMQTGFRHGHLSVRLLIRSFPPGAWFTGGWARLSGSLRHRACTVPSASPTPRAHRPDSYPMYIMKYSPSPDTPSGKGAPPSTLNQTEETTPCHFLL